MKELGLESVALHRSLGSEIGADLAAGRIHGLVCLGENARAIAEGAAETAGSAAKQDGAETIRAYDDGDQEKLIRNLLADKKTGDAYLVKGSHSMHMEIVAAALLGPDHHDGQGTEA
jgi:UDP-N-acetylmuramyl pentapeptide synthase